MCEFHRGELHLCTIAQLLSSLCAGGGDHFHCANNWSIGHAAQGRSPSLAQRGRCDGGHLLYNRCCADVAFLGGVRYLYLNQREGVQAIISEIVSTPMEISEKNRFHGGGLQLGLEGRYCALSNFVIKGGMSAAALIGKRESRYRSTLITAENSDTIIAPTLDLRAGATYALPLIWGILSLEINYEARGYFSVLEPVVRVIGGNQLVRERKDLFFAGPTFGASFSF